jgi:hypothetical protein
MAFIGYIAHSIHSLWLLYAITPMSYIPYGLDGVLLCGTPLGGAPPTPSLGGPPRGGCRRELWGGNATKIHLNFRPLKVPAMIRSHRS